MDPRPDILRDADRCVLCGLCLPHCPTYGLTHNEAESPRGRISLLQALAAGRLAPSETLAGHLHRCLDCRACESVCPSEVPYGRLLANGRAWLAQLHLEPPGPAPGWLTRRWSRRPLRAGARLLRRLVPLRPGRPPARGGIGRLTERLPPLPPFRPLPRFSPTPVVRRGTVGLFTGCTGQLLEQETLEAAIRLLNAFGFDVRTPRRQACCGALHLHRGDLAAAHRLARRNLAAFAEPLDAVVSIASGCQATLADYGEWLGDEAAEFVSRSVEITAFLAGQPWPETLQPAPLPGRVAVHEPCSVTRVLRQPGRTAALLGHIPELEVCALPGNDRCCGAAGDYMLREPELADQLREPKIAALAELQPQWLVSANVGCAVHLAAGARSAGLEMEVLHPVTLLARQLAPA